MASTFGCSSVEDGLFFFGDVLNPVRLSAQLLKHGVLPSGDAVHPPETDAPAGESGEVGKIEQKTAHGILN